MNAVWLSHSRCSIKTLQCRELLFYKGLEERLVPNLGSRATILIAWKAKAGRSSQVQGTGLYTELKARLENTVRFFLEGQISRGSVVKNTFCRERA